MTFTKELPTKPGDYRWTPDEKFQSTMVTVHDSFGKLWCPDFAKLPSDMGGLWCRLVPAEEVGKAYFEGHNDGFYYANGDSVPANQMFPESRAKRVMTGNDL